VAIFLASYDFQHKKSSAPWSAKLYFATRRVLKIFIFMQTFP